MSRTAALAGAAALIVLGTAACETTGTTSAPEPPLAPAAPSEPTVESRPELLGDIRPGSTTFSVACEVDGTVINYWPEHAWDKAVAECRN